jgi:hypothetical protein
MGSAAAMLPPVGGKGAMGSAAALWAWVAGVVEAIVRADEDTHPREITRPKRMLRERNERETMVDTPSLEKLLFWKCREQSRVRVPQSGQIFYHKSNSFAADFSLRRSICIKMDHR